MARIAFVGDVMLGRSVGEAIEAEGPGYPWGDTLRVLRSADIRIANLECPISRRGIPWGPKRFNFRAPPRAIESLKAAGIDCVSLANNHILDYGEEALADTISLLDRAGISHAGAGNNLREARTPAILERNGLTIGVASMTDNMQAWRASPDRPGINYVPLLSMPETVESIWLKGSMLPRGHPLSRVRNLLGSSARPVLNALAELRTRSRWTEVMDMLEGSLPMAEKADFTVLSCHWGPNWRTSPPGIFEEFARAALDRGADVIHGHSAHVFHGVGSWKGKPILFDTGDFVEDFPITPLRNDHSFIFLLDTDETERMAEKITLVPVRIQDCQVNLAKGNLPGKICRRMAALCAGMGTRTRMEEGSLVIEMAD